MARVCEVTGKGPMSRKQCFPRQQPHQASFSCPICSTAVSGWKPRTVGCVCAFPALHLRLIDKKGIDVVLADMRARGQA